MFGSSAKTPFGTGTFGSSSTSAFGGGQTTPFGQTSGGLFGAKTQGTSAFGTPTFGASTTPAFGTGSTSTGLFGNTNTGGNLFSQPTTQAAAGGGLFGSSAQSSSLFQAPQSSSVFGKSTGFGSTSLGTSAASTGGLFGSTFGASASGSTFGASTATSSGTGGLFGTTSVFGGTAATNGTTVKFNPVTNSESVVKNGVSMMVQTRHQCISVMKEYESKSLEELRLEDYTAGRKSGSSSSSLFGASTAAQSSSLFGGTTGSAFGQNKTSAFGGLGQKTTGTGLFGQTTQSGGLFGSKPTGTGSIFGAAKTTASTGFGFGTTGGLLGQTSSAGTTGSLFGGTAQSTGLFGASSGFGQTQTTSTGGLFGTSTFGQPQTGGLFGATSKPFGFGAASSGTSTFGTGTFGTGTSTGLFGNTATSKSAFSASTGGFGSSLGGFGATNTLGTGLFGATSSSGTGTGIFGTQNKTGFGTTLGATTGLGTGLGGTSAFGGTGGFGGLGTTTGLAANQGMAGIGGVNQSSFVAFQQQQVLQQQLKALANSPFGDSPLFRNLSTTRRTKEEDLLTSGAATATNNAASHYKVFSKPIIKVKKKPSPFPSSTKSKFFEDIYDDNALIETSLTPRTSVKKLVIKNKFQNLSNGEVINSPLRFRTFTEDGEDHSDLISHVPEVPVAPTLEDATESNEDTSLVVAESPALQQARRKTSIRSPADDTQDLNDQSASTADDNQTDVSGSQDEANACGITLRRDEYYTLPPIDELNDLVSDDGECNVENFIVGREDYGEVKFLGITNVKDLNLDEIVFFRRREVEVYPDNYVGKPKVGVELNKKSEISLHKVWPNDKTSHTPIKTPERLKKSGFIERLEERTSAMDALFLDYKPNTGTWVFQVDHFTRYGLNEQLFADDAKEDLLTKLKTAAQKKDAARELEAEKEKARLAAEKLRKEKEREIELDMDSQDPSEEGDDDDEGMVAESDDESQFIDENERLESGGAEHFSTGVQNAKIAGVDPYRLQGMKAVLFDEDEDDFMSPREKNLLSSKSLITGSVRESGLNERFDSAKKSKSGKEKLVYSLLSETTSPLSSPKKAPLKSQLLKTASYLGPEKALLRGKVTDSPSSLLFSPMPKDHQEHQQPSIITATRGLCLVPFQSSSLASKENLAADAALANGRRSRVGWAPKLRLVHAGEPVGSVLDGLKRQLNAQDSRRPNIFDPASRGAASFASSLTVNVEDINVGMDHQDDTYLVDCLKNSLRHCNINTESSSSPFIEPVDGVSSLHGFADLTCKFKERLGNFPKTDSRYQHGIVWDLFKALWGKLEHRTEEKLTSYQNRILRKAALTKWLSSTVEHDIKKEIDAEKFKDAGHLDAIYSLLTGRQIAAACKVAYQNREYRLALLLSQASGDAQLKHLLREQLGEWKDRKADKFMNLKRLKIYQLLSGMMVWMCSKGEINVCENFDWKRAFALHLWYYCPTTASISKALQEYKHSYRGTDSYSAYAESPNPCYMSNKIQPDDDPTEMEVSHPKDICYHLLKLYSERSHRLERTLCPNTHTSNPLDYALCWHMQQVLQSLGYTHISEEYHCLLQASFAAQLETYDLWEWAVYVLSHIKSPQRREVAVRDVITRHCHASEDPNQLSAKESFLVDSVKIPARWIFEAKALHARYSSKPYDEAIYLLKGGHWNSAHQVILRDLASDSIIDEDYSTLKELLLQLSLPERCCTVTNWTQSGQIFLDYMLLREKLFQIVEGEIIVTAYSLEDLRADVTSLMNRIAKMTADSPKERLAQAEMGKTSSNLLKIVLQELSKKGHGEDEEEEIDTKYTWSMCELAPYIAYLPLPPDYKQKELEELVCYTGERITEME